MKFVLQILRQLYQRVFRGGKPSPTMRPQKIQGSKPEAKPEGLKATPEKQQSGDRFWRDKVESDASEPKQRFYLKHRDRLENQDRNISRDR